MLDSRSVYLRKQIIRTLQAGSRGHIGASMSLVEILRVLYDDILNFRSNEPDWIDRDRCILSKGHGCLALYAILADKGYFSEEKLWTFCKPNGFVGGHPDHRTPGVEASTGSLGHGLSIGLGMALGARIDRRKNGVFVIIGDGESNEGSIWEAAMSAGKHGLERLTVLIDYNKQQSYSETSYVQDLEPLAEKWRSFGFGVRETDGHNVSDLRQTLKSLPFEKGKPNAIICHTTKGKGIKGVEGNLKWHHKSRINNEDIQFLLNGLPQANA